MLLSGETAAQVKLDTPKGVTLYLDVERIKRESHSVECAVRKDSGDDPDVTNNVYVYARVEKIDGEEIELRGGAGIGIVTREGLEQAVGEPAINRVPRQMIREAVRSECLSFGYHGGLAVTISIPEGVRLAGQTFNPRLGIKGGLSVLGTTGIVEPMSEQALIDTIRAEMRMLRAGGYDVCYVVPGNYGFDFLKETLGYQGDAAVKCSNYIGETIDVAAELQMKGLLFVGHAGKLVKVAAGVMNTHSHQADGRLEVLAAHGAMNGAGRDLVCRIMGCVTTSEALELLKEEGLLESVMCTVMEKIKEHLAARAKEGLEIGAVMFEPRYGILGMTGNTEALSNKIRRDQDRKE
jgi:cobalamin biosynthesis protein CbiD